MPVEVGAVAPDFTLRDQDLQPLALAELRGRNVVLLFFPGAFSPGCMRQMTALAGEVDRYAAHDAEVLGVSTDGPFALRAFREAMGLRGVRLLSDFEPKGEVTRRYGVLHPLGFPERATFVIDRAGVVREAFVAADPDDVPEGSRALGALAACEARPPA